MADPADELIDYEEDDESVQIANGTESTSATASKEISGIDKSTKKGYVGIHSTGFRDFLLKPELLRAIVDCGFEHPSEGVSGL